MLLLTKHGTRPASPEFAARSLKRNVYTLISGVDFSRLCRQCFQHETVPPGLLHSRDAGTRRPQLSVRAKRQSGEII